MTTTMTLTDDDWTAEAIAACYADSGDTAPYAADCADTELAWLINHVADYLPGWHCVDGGFSGPPYDNALGLIMDMVTEAADYVLSVLEEIAAEHGGG